jgi:hypothetical protein
VAGSFYPEFYNKDQTGLSSQTSDKVKNPDGSKGKQDHQDEVKSQADKARAEAKPGETVREGTKIQSVDSNRRPNVQVVGTDKKVVKVIEVERKPKSKRNRTREEEYDRLEVPNQTVPLP